MTTYFISLIRTGVPVIVGAVASWLLVHYGLHVSADQVAGVTTVLTGVLTTAYYAAVRALEKRWPKIGWLLGVPATVTYSK